MWKIIGSFGLAVATYLGLYTPPIFDFYTSPPVYVSEPRLGADTVLPIGGAVYTLSGAGVSSSASSFTLSSLTIPQTGQKLQDSDFSTTFYVTLEPGNRTRQEFVSCTTVTQNAAGTATLSGCSRGLSPITPYTASTTLQFAHAGGTQVIFSDPPHLYNQFAAKDNDETITGSWLFPTPTVATNAATKSYVDGGILAGAATSTESVTGISRLATKTQTASSTPTTANTPLVIQAQSATSSPYTHSGSGNTYVVVTEDDGYIAEGFIDYSVNTTRTGTVTHSATTTLAGIAVGTSSPSIVGANFGTSTYFSKGVGIGVSTTTESANLQVSGNTILGVATATTLTVNKCVGCLAYTGSSTAFSVSATAATTFTGSIPTNADFALVNYIITDTGGFTCSGFGMIARAGLTSADAQCSITSTGPVLKQYSATIAWSGSNLVVDEDVDTDSDGSIAGTAYWYK